ncbi:MAG: matrixin family metalloprotease [Caldilineaceae bacterium]
MRLWSLIRKFQLSWLSICFSLMLVGLTSEHTQAYTVDTRVWPSSGTTYTKDAEFLNQGAGWGAVADNAVADWNGTGTFVFSGSSSSANHFQAHSQNCNEVANTYSVTLPGQLYVDHFLIVVNVGPPCNLKFYDGTGTPTIPPGYFDLRSILRHELGHALGLKHTYASGHLMTAGGIPVETVVQIDTDATNGAQYLYNPNYTGVFPDGPATANYVVGAGTWDGIATVTQNNVTLLPIGYKGGNWTSGNGFSRAYNSTDSYANSYHASTWLSFNGGRITRSYEKASNRGNEDVFIDGVFKETMTSGDNKFYRWQVQKTWTVTSGQHTIEVRSNNTSTSLYTDLDAFIVDIPCVSSGSYEDSDTLSNKYIGSTWTHATGWSGPSQGTVSWSNTYQDAVSFTFNSTGITYVFTKSWNRGKASITIDGSDWGTLDLYSPSALWQQTAFYPLSSGIHTIHVMVTGQKNAASSDYFVDLDRFIVQ